LHPSVRAHLQNFDVTEDWPLQVAIARQFPEHKFDLIDAVLVYYRRTPGSIYIVANHRFVKDKILIYNDLIINETNWMEKFRLLSRKVSFLIKYRQLSKIINVDLYFFAISFVFNFNKIKSEYEKIEYNLNGHLKHYACIKDHARLLKIDLEKPL
jgi:hypothetical protein